VKGASAPPPNSRKRRKSSLSLLHSCFWRAPYVLLLGGIWSWVEPFHYAIANFIEVIGLQTSAWFPLLSTGRFAWHLCNLHCAYTMFWLISVASCLKISTYWFFSRDKDWNIPWTCCLLAFDIVMPGPAVRSELFGSTVCCFSNLMSLIADIIFIFVRFFFGDCRSFISRKLYVCIDTLLCFLHQFDRAHVSWTSRSRC